jgi:hypothetical protein
MMDILDCGHSVSPHSSITTGYGLDSEGKTYCYDCCANRERQHMRDKGKTCLYLVKNDAGSYELTDWPGQLRFKPHYVYKGRHNKARVRYDGQFTGPDGATWRFTQYGDNTQIAHCKRIKGK